MLKWLTIVCLCLWKIRNTAGFEDILGISLDYDPKYRDLANIWDAEEPDIWDENKLSESLEQAEILKSLCKQYEVKIYGQIVDCNKLELIPKIPEEHGIRKREVKEEQIDEGSGDGGEEIKPTYVKQPRLEVDQLNTTQAPSTTISETSPKVQSTVRSTPTQELANISTELVPVNVTEAKKEAEEDQKKTDKEVKPAAIPVESQPNATTSIPENQTIKEDNKKGRKYLAMAAEAEDLNSQQSGNAILTAGGKSLEGTDTAVNRMSPKETIKAEDINLRASSKETSSRNDTKILIFLFATVVAIGIAAFAYNYTKKKRRQNQQATPRRQNGVTRDDVEEGREMKPLMKNNESEATKSETEKEAA